MKRPTSVTVFGVLNIVFGVFGLLSLLFAAAFLAAAKATGAHRPLVFETLHSHVYRVWTTVSLPLGFVAAGVLVVAGVGLLVMKRWARVMTIVYAIYALVQALAGIAITFTVLLPAAVEASSRRGPEAIAAIAGFVGAIVGGVLGLAYPILLLIFMTRPRVVEAFRASEGTPLSSS
jgi:hypothetical protein